MTDPSTDGTAPGGQPTDGTAPGTVYVVGAGPGDPELLTVKARRLLRSADRVLHDALVGDAVVDAIPEGVVVEDVGKRPGGERTSQAAIHDRLVAAARRGEAVVRLKGGDPAVFGRGGEELEALAAADVPVVTVPGVTSAVAAPEVAGIPPTHRDRSSSLTVVTGHEDPTKDESALDWAALADTVVAGGTLVVLMGVARLPENVAALREHGVPADTPVAMVERATLPGEQVVVGSLDTIVGRADDAGIEPPATTVVGDVVETRTAVADALGAATRPGGGNAGGSGRATGAEDGPADGSSTVPGPAVTTDAERERGWYR